MDNKRCEIQPINLEERYDLGKEVVAEQFMTEIRVSDENFHEDNIAEVNKDGGSFNGEIEHMFSLRQSSLPEIFANSSRRGILLLLLL